MKKKLVSILLAASLAAVTLAGCGKTDNAETETATSVSKVTSTEEKAEVALEKIPEAKYYYSFDEAAGTAGIQPTGQDKSKSGADILYAAEKEVKYMPGVKGDAVYTDGVTGYKLTDVNGVGETYTISFWIYATRYANYMPTVQYGPDVHGDVTGGQHYTNITRAEWNPDGASFPCVWSYDQNNKDLANNWPNWFPTEADEHLKQWMMITLVVDESKKYEVDGTALVGTLYINGEEYVKTDSDGNVVPVLITPGCMSQSDNYDFLLGVNYWDSIFKGAFDELYIFDKALTAGEVASLYADCDATAAFVEPERVITVAKDDKAIASIGSLDQKVSEAYAPEAVKLADGSTMQVKLKHWSDGAETANNYFIKFFDAEGNEVACVNADMTGYLNGDASKKIDDAAFSWSWDNWKTWESFVMVETNVTVEVTREGKNLTVSMANVDINATNNSGTVTFATDAEAVTMQVGNRLSYTDILSVKDATPQTGGRVLGALDQGFWTTFSPIWEVPVNGSKTVSFTNYTAGDNAWENFVAILQSTPEGHSADTAGYKEYAVVRADNWGWGENFDNADEHKSSNWNWDTFNSDMDGAHIVLTATNNGSEATIEFTATTAAGEVYTQSYTGIAVDGPVYLTFTDEKSYQVFDSNTMGALDQGFWTTFSDIWEVPEGGSKEISFVNTTAGDNAWENFVAILQSTPAGHSAETEGYKEYAVVRADNWGWGENFDNTDEHKSCDWNWDTFTSDMDGASVVLKATNKDGEATISFTATTVNGTVYHQTYTGIAVDGPVYLTLTCEKSQLVIDAIKVGAADLSQGFWTVFAPIWEVPAGASKSVSFTNVTAGENNWENYVAILQSTPTGHSAETEGYKEYAVVRADNWGWGENFDNTDEHKSCTWNWDTFANDMNGAHVTLTVTNTGSEAAFDIYVTSTDGTVNHQTYSGIAVDGPVYLTFTLEKSTIAFD